MYLTSPKINYLLPSILAIDEVEINSNQLIISNDSETILVQYITTDDLNMEQLKIYDVLGRLIFDTKSNEKKISLKSNYFAEGSLLIFKEQLSNGESLTKKFIKF